MELTAKNVHDTFKHCLFNSGESTNIHTVGEGIKVNAGFHPTRLKESTASISEMLDCLPDDFKEKLGGGQSFLNMCNDKDGVQWADLHSTMDELVALGNAAGKLSFVMPRKDWNMFPGGMPYIVIKN